MFPRAAASATTTLRTFYCDVTAKVKFGLASSANVLLQTMKIDISSIFYLLINIELSVNLVRIATMCNLLIRPVLQSLPGSKHGR